MPNQDFIFFEKLELDHVLKMINWGEHANPLFEDYNMGLKTEKDCRRFLHYKTFSPLNKYFAIMYSAEVIGFIGLKNINPIFKSSTLGLVLNPSLVSMGFGSLLLPKFLKYYFDELKMKTMYLLVSGYNDRARRLYEKVGFSYIKEYLEPYVNVYLDENSKEYKDNIHEFVKHGDDLYSYAYKMELKRKDFDFEVFV